MNSKPNIYDGFNFIEMQKKQLVSGYAILRSNEPAPGRQAVLSGMLIALGSFNEALRLLTKFDPELSDAANQYADDLGCWRRLRNDVAHVFERIFGEPRGDANSPWIEGGLCIATYDPETDIVRTGDDDRGRLVLEDAIRKTFQIDDAIQLIHHKTPRDQYNKYRAPVEEQIRTMRRTIMVENGAQ